jgi:alpha-1,2-mannosyltransferase
VPGARLQIAGVVAFGAVLLSWLIYKYTHPYGYTLQPVDLHVYTIGGLIVRHVRPWYSPHLASPLYDWSGYTSLHLPFSYTPFAALVFSVVSFIPWAWLPKLSVLWNIVLLVAALWFTYGGLGYRNRQVRIGATLLTAAAVFWTEPVVRVIYLGQIELALLALIMWDMCQPDRRRWKGAGVGIAAGIKLVPLIFIAYLLVTRRFRQAIVASAAFVATIAAGFAILPGDSSKYWFTGLFWNGGSRAGFEAWEGNQSLRALTARVLGSLAGSEHAWLAIDVLAIIVGLACAAMLDRKGYRMAGLMAAALTGLLASPISWDHHWVWIVPFVALAAHYAVQAMAAAGRGLAPGRGDAAGWRDWTARARLWASSLPGWGCWAVVAVILVAFGAWPGSLWGEPHDMGQFSLGLLWFAPGTGMSTYEALGDRPYFAEYRWHGLNLLAGNAFVLTGIGLLALLLILAWYAPYPRLATGSAAAEPGDEQAAAQVEAALSNPDVASASAAIGANGANGAGNGTTANGTSGGKAGSPDPEAAAGQSAGTGAQSPASG